MMRADGPFKVKPALCRGGKGEEGRHFHVVGINGVFRAVQFIRALDFQFVGADPFDLCTHFVEQFRQLLDMRFAGGVPDDRFSRCNTGGNEDLFRGGDAGFVQKHIGAPQFFGNGKIRHAFPDVARDPQFSETVVMGVQPASADEVAAGQPDMRFPATVSHRTCKQDRPTDPGAHFGGQGGAADCLRMDLHGLAVPFHFDTDTCCQIQHHLHVHDLRHVVDHHFFFSQQARRHDRQGCVFVAARNNGAGNFGRPFNDQTFHRSVISCFWGENKVHPAARK